MSGKPVPKSEQVGGKLKKTLSFNDNVSKHNTSKEPLSIIDKGSHNTQKEKRLFINLKSRRKI
jgi:hypothetical protein